ncbi:MAG TPA: PVC-type heme-binding CxxCH protein [Methylomirabilota bacterium]|nr:PVC-type heme-binding CxxCH protein [Methylomirabilota bacterium]
MRLKAVALLPGLVLAFFIDLLAAPLPRVHDPRLELSLFASDPEIVTPIGVAIDSKDRVYVIESHTHMPPRDYKGPKSDRIKVLEDTDSDGKADRISIFAEGFTDAMNLAFSPDGVLHIVCAREVWALRDTDADGKSDSHTRLLELKTSNTYSHSALLGITFGPDGWLYLSRGNNGSARYTLLGHDVSSVSGYGDGGNIVRCRPDGSKLEEFATGFWNAFDLKFDSHGRLLAVDNDPDARGPNRLLHIVRGGDYGYRSIYGGSGNHPFQGWDGDLPGTLPMVDGTGEAPSGLIDAAQAAFPVGYQDTVLVTVWNENKITAHKLTPRGASVSATHRSLVEGGQDFRPVALEADSKGALFITDWVQVDYPNHGRGRIWKLAARSGGTTNKPRPPFAATVGNPASKEFDQLAASAHKRQFTTLKEALKSRDPFVRHAAIVGLTNTVFYSELLHSARDSDSSVRLGSLLALRRAGYTPEEEIHQALRDPSVPVRTLALIWIGEAGLESFKDQLDLAIAGPDVTPQLFETYLAAVECLQPDYLQAYRSGAKDKAAQLERRLPPGLVKRLFMDEQRSPAVRALALRRMDAQELKGALDTINRLAGASDWTLQKEAIRTLGVLGTPESASALKSLALSPFAGSKARCEALLALSTGGLGDCQPFLSLLNDAGAEVQIEAARLLRFHSNDETVRNAFSAELRKIRTSGSNHELREQLEFALGTSAPDPLPRPKALEQWLDIAGQGGNPEAGERVFFSPATGCAQCHTVEGRGGRLGPDLSNIGQSVDRAQIARSILRPSEQFPPQYQAWFIKTKDGDTHEGLQLDHKAGGALELITRSGDFQTFKGEVIDSYGVLPRSLMPDGLEESMTVSDFRNLLSFLAGQK